MGERHDTPLNRQDEVHKTVAQTRHRLWWPCPQLWQQSYSTLPVCQGDQPARSRSSTAAAAPDYPFCNHCGPGDCSARCNLRQ